jgi:hypothetical protein
LEANEQIFYIFAALTAAGYDPGAGADTGSEARGEVRALLAGKNPSVLPELRQFFAEHQVSGDSAANLGQYISLALFLGPPPQFRFTVAQTDLPPDAKALAGLVPLLKKFYDQANLIALWARFQSRHHARVLPVPTPIFASRAGPIWGGPTPSISAFWVLQSKCTRGSTA